MQGNDTPYTSVSRVVSLSLDRRSTASDGDLGRLAEELTTGDGNDSLLHDALHGRSLHLAEVSRRSQLGGVRFRPQVAAGQVLILEARP
jgi:hypothetical protein